MIKNGYDIETEVLIDESIETAIENHIVIYNDDVNSFEHVILTLMEVLGHSSIQAEQCALIIHHNGKCSVKGGSYEKLKPLCEAILDRKISATIE